MCHVFMWIIWLSYILVSQPQDTDKMWSDLLILSSNVFVKCVLNEYVLKPVIG